MSDAAPSPLVSVVIPCFNSGSTLPETLASLERQTYAPLEVIVIDDGSTDSETAALLDSLRAPLRMVRQINKGLPAARNTGFREANGAYVLPLDADDWLEPDAVARMMEALKARPEASFAFCHLALEGEASGVLEKRYNHFEQLFLNQLPYCLLLPKRLWEEVGGYDESMRKGYEDWEFNIRLGGAGHFGTDVAAPLFHYRVSGSGMLASISRKRHGELWRAIQRRNPQLYRLGALYRSWRGWRERPATRRLWMYFLWLGAFRLLPSSAFQALFGALMRFSHSRRVAAKAAADTAPTASTSSSSSASP